VPSPKTEHHEGREARWIPLFPEIRQELDALWNELPDGTEGAAPIVTRYRDVGQNLRTTFEKIIRRAGLEPWPKLFQNLRSTRETELAETFPVHVVCAWLGNTQAVANKHYLQVTEEHFEKAAGDEAEKAARKQAQQAAVSDGKGRKSAPESAPLSRGIPIFTEEYTAISSPSLSQLDPYFVERGTLVIKKLQRSRVIVLHPWNESVDESTSPKPTPNERPNGMKLARHYQALLDTGRFESRAALARYLGVSRARVTQVLKRLSVLPAGGLG